ncbi:MAG: transglutaminase-like putative cysteine protease [Myxococcota bacterium]|jgi:transglutaminase-like putative cysteine protease
MDPFVSPDRHVDSDHPAVVAYAEEHANGLPPREAAVALYLAVRDGFRYNPYRLFFTPDAFTASGLLLRERSEGGHCIDKALLLAAAARAVGIPSRLHFANVRNHVGTSRLEAHLGTDLLVFHGYTGLFLAGQWVAATPAFNAGLCARLGVAPLEFDGTSDSIFQAYDAKDGRFMEYVTDHGAFATIPFELMLSEWRTHYGPLLEQAGALGSEAL